MILIHGTARLRAGARDAFVEAARPMIAASRAEDGCHAYRYAFDLTDPELVSFHEEWESDEALQAHYATAHLATFGAALGDLLAERPTIQRSVVTETGPLG